jgi:tRNA-binding EMAP/Myf-like protein
MPVPTAFTAKMAGEKSKGMLLDIGYADRLRPVPA